VKTLIIRSSSMERLDCLLKNIMEKRGNLKGLDILTHSHAAPSIRKNYPEVGVIEYPFKGDFKRSFVKTCPETTKFLNGYGEVVVLVSNITGTGHLNVIDTAFAFGKNVRLFNINNQFMNVPTSDVYREKLGRLFLSPLIISATLCIAIWGIFRLTRGLMGPRITGEVDGELCVEKKAD